VTDVADALIMVQVFDELWKRGTVVVSLIYSLDYNFDFYLNNHALRERDLNG
jgi:hypothetical protein